MTDFPFWVAIGCKNSLHALTFDEWARFVAAAKRTPKLISWSAPVCAYRRARFLLARTISKKFHLFSKRFDCEPYQRVERKTFSRFSCNYASLFWEINLGIGRELEAGRMPLKAPLGMKALKSMIPYTVSLDSRFCSSTYIRHRK